MENEDECINPVDKTQEILKLRLCRKHTPSEILGHEYEIKYNGLSACHDGNINIRESLQYLLRRYFFFGEGRSLLIVGPRGNGKSALIEKALVEIGEEEELHTNLLQVHLNGLLQTDETIALKEIIRQLHLEDTVGDRVFGSFAEALKFLLEAIKSGNQSSEPILFILNEFEHFLRHRKQTLLYDLFATAQTSQTIFVLGIARSNVNMEVRLIARFSHLQINVLNNMTFEDYVMLFKQLLKLEEDFPDRKFQSDWNKSIEELSEAQSIVDMLKKKFSFSQDICALKQLLFLPVCLLNEKDTQRLTPEMFVESLKISNTDSVLAMLCGISFLELCLIIAMKHCQDTSEGFPFTFEMILYKYRKFAQRHSSMQVFDKAVVLKAFEHLVALEFLKPVEDECARVQKEYRLWSLWIESTQIMDALQKYPQCPNDVRNWASFYIS